MDYKINWDSSEGVFAVPDAVADSALKLASGKALKVIIYLLRNRTLPENPEDIGVSAEDEEDALSYWESVGIISKCASSASQTARAVSERSETAGVKILAAPPAALAAPASPASTASPAFAEAVVDMRPRKALLPSEISERIEQSEEIAFLFKSAESSLKRILTFDDQRTLIWFYDHLGMNAEIIIMLIGYCCSIEKYNMQYIEKIAVKWHEKGITAYEQAENEILLMQKSRSFEGKVCSRLKLQNKLTASQKSYIDKWAQWDISVDLVELAYDKTVDSTGKVTFNYMNKILQKWHDNGISDVRAAEEYDERTKPVRSARALSTADTARKTAQKPSAPSFDLSLIMERAKNSTPSV